MIVYTVLSNLFSIISNLFQENFTLFCGKRYGSGENGEGMGKYTFLGYKSTMESTHGNGTKPSGFPINSFRNPRRSDLYHVLVYFDRFGPEKDGRGGRVCER